MATKEQTAEPATSDLPSAAKELTDTLHQAYWQMRALLGRGSNTGLSRADAIKLLTCLADVAAIGSTLSKVADTIGPAITGYGRERWGDDFLQEAKEAVEQEVKEAVEGLGVAD